MSYYVFFDESGKIDRQKNKFSYYGSLGMQKKKFENLNDVILKANFKREMHFNKFNLTCLEQYITIINEIMNDLKFNIYLVNRNKALDIADRISIDKSELRELLYIKIPERLIYGILRYLKQFNNIEIFIDECDEYKKYDIEYKLKYQLNAQSIYRNKYYFVKYVRQIDSKKNIGLQVTDVLLGIVNFLIEKKYYNLKENLTEKEFKFLMDNLGEMQKKLIEKSYKYKDRKKEYVIENNNSDLENLYENLNFYTQSSIQKGELIYKLLDDPKKIRLFNKINIFVWDEVNDNVDKLNLADYVSEFFLFKNKFDNYNKIRIMNHYMNNTKDRDWLELLGYGKNLSKMIQRYLEELKII